MRSANVYRSGEIVGVLIETDEKTYEFRYDEEWFNNPKSKAVSVTLPKVQKQFVSKHLFPFFFNMLSEGVNRAMQSRQLRIDEQDYFGLLLEIAQSDTIGAITLKPIERADL